MRTWILLAICSCCFAQDLREFFISDGIEKLEVSSWEYPTCADYAKIAAYNKERTFHFVDMPLYERPFTWSYEDIQFYDWITYRMDRITMTSAGMAEGRRIDYLGNSHDQRDMCVICYAGYKKSPVDRNYIRAMEFIGQALKNSGFKGHYISYRGGWPGAKQGRLKYADVPYGFKPFLFEEVRAMGYKKILWVDACSLPLGDLTPVFEHMAQHGVIFKKLPNPFRFTGINANFLRLYNHRSLDKDAAYTNVVTQVVGIDTTHEKGNQLLNMWIEDAELKLPFLMSDQPPFLFLINLLGLQNAHMPEPYFLEGRCGTGMYRMTVDSPLFYHHYDLLDDNYPLPTRLIKR